MTRLQKLEDGKYSSTVEWIRRALCGVIHQKMTLFFYLLLSCLSTFSHAATARSITIPMYLTSVQTPNKQLGTVTIQESKYGLLFTPHLKDLTPGLHGFHIHQLPSCNEQGMAAGGHLDPQKTNNHLGPYALGHLGDLPGLYVAPNGGATTPVLAPHLPALIIDSFDPRVFPGHDHNYIQEEFKDAKNR